jgi:hypothetical protein
METTFDKFINNDPDEKKLFEKEYADFAVSEFALEKMDEKEYDALDEYYTTNTLLPIGKPGFFASRKAAEQRKAPISHWTGNTVKVLETAYPESSFGLFSVVKDSASIEPEETDPNYTAQKNNRGKITEKLNEVYDDDYYEEFEPIARAGLESIREATKNDYPEGFFELFGAIKDDSFIEPEEIDPKYNVQREEL